MNSLESDFNKLALQRDQPNSKRPKYPPPFSIRFTFEERARLDERRGREPLSSFIRGQLFGDDAAPRKRRGNSLIKDAEALGRVLGALGAARLASNLNQLA